MIQGTVHKAGIGRKGKRWKWWWAHYSKSGLSNYSLLYIY